MENGGEGPAARRLLLLTTAHSYRNDAFRAGAAAAGVDVVVGYDAPPPHAAAPGRAGAAGDGGAGYWALDLQDPQAAAQAAAALARAAPLAAVLPVDDSGVRAAAAVAAALGLPYNAPAAAEAARDKFVMRTALAAAGVRCPWFRRCTLDLPGAGAPWAHVEAQLEAIARDVPYPCVLKPLALNGSRGVMRADDPQDFVARGLRLARLLAREYGPGPRALLVESFLPGQEVALEGLLEEGELTVLALFDKPDPLDGPFFEETIYVTPSRLPPAVQAAVAAQAAAAARAIGLRNGPVHAELRLNAAGPWLLEIAGRSIGGLCGQVLRFGLEGGAGGGMTLEELIVRQACGLPWRAAVAARAGARGAAGVMMIPIPAAGQLRAVEGVAEAEAVPGVTGVEISVGLHHTVTPLPEGEAYLGFIFARGETPAAVEGALRAAHACLRFTIVPEFLLG